MRTSLIRSRHWIENRGWRGFAAEIVRRSQLILSGKQPLLAPAGAALQDPPAPFDA